MDISNMINHNGYDLSRVQLPVECDKIHLILPQRYPLLLVDKIIKVSASEIVAIKSVTMGEPSLLGHFPTEPVFPGIYTLEACAQTATLLGFYAYCHPTNPEEFQLAVRMVTVDKLRFKKEIWPGDVLEVTAIHLGKKTIGDSNFHSFKTIGRVGGKIVVQAEMMGYFFNRLDRKLTLQDPELKK